MGGWVGVGWLEKSDIELTSAKVEVEVRCNSKMQLICHFAFPVYLSRGLDTFSVRLVVGWMVGEMKIKAK